MLSELGFNEGIAGDDAVAILVGPNGSGKSIHLHKIALEYRYRRSVNVLSTTIYDRFAGMRGVNRFSAGRGGQSPKGIIKAAIAKTLDRESSEFYQINSILEYCGYAPRFGFKLDGHRPDTFEKLQLNDGDLDDLLSSPEAVDDFEAARHFLDRWPRDGMMWIDARGPVHEFSARREFAAVLRIEALLSKAKLLRRIRVYLEKQDGAVFELQHASSGELSLISSLVFLSTTVEQNSIVLIDEPENSLHPSWQREYVGKIFSALAYRNVSIIIATHSPLVVTGAISEYPDLVSVYQMQDGVPCKLKLDGASPGDAGIEAVLWRAFDVVTPANHFVSEEIVEAMDRFERGQIDKSDVLSFIEKLRKKSTDRKQLDFFDAVVALVDKVEARKNAPQTPDPPLR
ncbi:AAA family ATPase [Agrobacterium tumefaciens]|uniref:AAA family ATPase n=1 Tax=Agrobacterium tumefaciens TaxID=358 RepID=UPI0021CECC90|nr:ATP-binding protein [Agrobacterium tumefaciens]